MVRVSGLARAAALAQSAAIGLAALALGACGHSSGTDTVSVDPGGIGGCDPSNPATAAECGTLLIAMTDAEGEILNYSVDVLALTLERADGSTVEALPVSTRIDFAELTELSEIVGAAALPPGVFVGATIRLDYTTAEVFVEAGGDIVPAEIVDRDGNALGIVDLRVRLSNEGRLVVTRGRVAFLSIDFDLAASHSVDTSLSTPRVVAEPFVTAEVAPVTEKEIRVRGALVDVDLASQSYEIRLDPWHRRLAQEDSHGPLTVGTTAETHFEIGDATYSGNDGLEALAALEPGTLTAAFGVLDLDDRRFTASVVLARDSVDGNGIDTVRGNIVARSGDLLTVRGAWSSHRNDRPRFRRTVFVEVGPDTHVLKIRDRDGIYSEDDLSVGQKIVAFGEFRDPANSLDATTDSAPVLDATGGRVRMHVTHLFGEISDFGAGLLTMRLRAIDRLSADLFDFTGTGQSAGLDAIAEAYEVATGTLPLDAVEVGRPVRVLGFVTPFGFAPPDFEGRTIVAYPDVRSALGISWLAPGTTAPFLSMGPEGLVPDLENPTIGARHHLLIGGQLVDLFDLPATTTIEPSVLRAWFSLHEPGHVEMFADFTEFVDALTARLNDSDTVASIAAYGFYDGLENSLSARKLAVFTLPAE